MKKLLALLLCMTLALPLASCAGLFGDGSGESESESETVEAPRETVPGFSGEGTEASPYLISTRSDLLRLVSVTTAESGATICKDIYFRLEADIDLGGMEWLPIAAFGGIFDGNGHTISNFKITDETEAKSVKVGSIEYYARLGLFGVVHGGTVKNLTVTGAVVTVNGSSDACGVLAGSAHEGTFEKCTVKESSVTVSNSEYGTVEIGALVGNAELTVIDSCTVTNAIVIGKTADHVLRTNEEAYVGGLVGKANWYEQDAELPANGQIRGCQVTATVMADMHTNGGHVFAGGIAGTANTLRECAFLGTVNAGNITSSLYVGGVAGTATELNRCFANATITYQPHQDAAQLYNTGYFYFGGIAGAGSKVNECGFKGEIAMPNDTAGEVCSGGILAILRENGTVKNCATEGIVKAAQKRHSSDLLAGGIVASVAKGATVEGCISSAEVKTSIGEDVGWAVYAGGIAGRLKESGTVKSCLFAGTLSAYAQKLAKGSVVGHAPSGSTLEKCYATSPEGSIETSCRGEAADDATLSTATFYVDTLGLSGDVWKIESPNAAMKSFPTLKSEIKLTAGESGGENGDGNGDSALLPDGPITCVEDLFKLRMDGKYELAADINCEGAKLYPIGTPEKPFTGTLDGKGFAISNFSITDGYYELGNVPTTYYGLFGYNKGTITNLTIAGASVSAVTENRVYGGMLAAYNAGTITNCRAISGGVYSATTGACILGGLVGYNVGGSIHSCAADVSVHAQAVTGGGRVIAGGLVGIYEGTQQLYWCYATGDVKASVDSEPMGTTPYAGGLVGECSADVVNCYATGNVEATSPLENPDGYPRLAVAGGLVGSNHATVMGSFALGNVRAQAFTTQALAVCDGSTDLVYGCMTQVIRTKEASNQVGDLEATGNGIEYNRLLSSEFLSSINIGGSPWVIVEGACPVLECFTVKAE